MTNHPQRHCHQQRHSLLFSPMSISYRLFFSFTLICLSHRCHQTGADQLVPGEDQLGGLHPYKISWKGPPNDKDQEYFMKDNDDVIHISTKASEKYVCTVPEVRNLNFDTSAKNSSTKEAEQLSPIQMLSPLLSGNICSYKFKVFWIYELCHGKYLRQYHEENTKYKAKVTQEYYLGKMEPEQIQAHDEEYRLQNEDRLRTGEPMPTMLINGHYKPYVVFNMTGGTKCDITNQNRVSRIIYACNEEPNIEFHSIREIATCEYEAVVLAPMLCQHEDFKVDVNVQQEIKCFSLEGAPTRPKKTLDYEDDSYDSDLSDGKREAQKRTSRAYLQGRTLIIDMDSILS